MEILMLKFLNICPILCPSNFQEPNFSDPQYVGHFTMLLFLLLHFLFNYEGFNDLYLYMTLLTY